MHGGAKLVECSIKVCFPPNGRDTFGTYCCWPIDNDDDGETAAGGRLAHLLQILVQLLFSLPLWLLKMLRMSLMS